jgi:hypothetical protein
MWQTKRHFYRPAFLLGKITAVFNHPGLLSVKHTNGKKEKGGALQGAFIITLKGRSVLPEDVLRLGPGLLF